MQLNFHYYATYCAAFLAGYTHEDSLAIAYCAEFTDDCSATLLRKLHAPKAAASSQLQLEMMDMRMDMLGIQEMTRIWASFHFLPYDLHADVKRGRKLYKSKYRLICDSNGELIADMIHAAKGQSLQAVGIAMHVLADTWAHKYFAGVPSQVINSTNDFFYEYVTDEHGKLQERKVNFNHNAASSDDIINNRYINSIAQNKENSIMNLGHGRAGHFPDYSFARYKYLPAWGGYKAIYKDNPSDFYFAFTQMIYAMRYLRGDINSFELNTYDEEKVKPYEDKIRAILRTRQKDSSEDWKIFGERLSGKTIEPFTINKYWDEYEKSEQEDKKNTFLGKFFEAAIRHKAMVTSKIFLSGNLLAGYSATPENGFRAIKDYRAVMEERRREAKK